MEIPSAPLPSNVFICCLGISDFTVGLLTQPCFVIHKIGEILHWLGMYCATRMVLESLGNITSGASVLTMAGANIERCLALFFHLRYDEFVIVRRVLFSVACFWIFLIALALFRVFLIRPEVYNTIFIALLSLCLLSTYLAYANILRCVRQHERRINTELIVMRSKIEEKAAPLRNILRYKKSTINMIIIVGVFTACFQPLLCVKLAHKVLGYTVPVKALYVVASTIVLLNSSLNPLVYFWRMKTMRIAVKTVFKDRLCKSRR